LAAGHASSPKSQFLDNHRRRQQRQQHQQDQPLQPRILLGFRALEVFDKSGPFQDGTMKKLYHRVHREHRAGERIQTAKKYPKSVKLGEPL
jgi:hypothetical protein